jgi:hypothetical protein
VQESRAQQIFQLLHRCGHRGTRQAQVVGGLGKAAEFGHARKNAHVFQEIHCWSLLNKAIAFTLFIHSFAINRLCPIARHFHSLFKETP